MSDADVTRLLHLAIDGDEAAAADLLPLVYERLRAVAGSYFRGRADQTLQPTALVHEAYLRLVAAAERPEGAQVRDREHFCAIAATAMRQILADRARRRGALKRGGDRERVALEAVAASEGGGDEADLVALDEALRKLEAIDARRARVVELRFLGGLSVDETARQLGVSPRTVESDWRSARAWLRSELAAAE